MKKSIMYFKVDTNALLNEIAQCAIPTNYGVLKIPLNIFKNYLVQIAERCSEINDPVLNMICCNMALYEQASPSSKEYDRKMVDKVKANYKHYEHIKNLSPHSNI